MPTAPVTNTVVRAILSENINLSADEVIKRAKLRGVTAPEATIRTTAHNIKSSLKKAAAKASSKPAAPKPVPAAARATAPAVVTPAPTTPPGLELSAVLANVALVNAVVGACGGPEPARKVAEAVKACGGVEAFLQHLDLVAQVRG